MSRLIALLLALMVVSSCSGRNRAVVVGTLYAADGKVGVAGNLYVIDPATGAAVIVGPIGFAVTGLAFHPGSGNLYATEATDGGTTNPSRLLMIDPATGAGTVIGDLFEALAAVNHNSIADITFVGNRLIGWSETGDNPVEIDSATGAVTVIQDSPIGSAGSGLAADAVNTVYFAPDGNDGDLFTIDPVTGDGTAGPTLSGGVNSQLNAMTFLNGNLYAIDNTDDGDPGSPTQLVMIDVTTGVITPVGSLPPGVDSLASLNR